MPDVAVFDNPCAAFRNPDSPGEHGVVSSQFDRTTRKRSPRSAKGINREVVRWVVKDSVIDATLMNLSAELLEVHVIVSSRQDGQCEGILLAIRQ